MSTGAEAQPLFSCCTFFSNCECQLESLLVYCNVKHLLLIQISSVHIFFSFNSAQYVVVFAFNTYKQFERYLSDVFESVHYYLFDGKNINRQSSSIVDCCQLLLFPVRDTHEWDSKKYQPYSIHLFFVHVCVVITSNDFTICPLRSAIGITLNINKLSEIIEFYRFFFFFSIKISSVNLALLMKIQFYFFSLCTDTRWNLYSLVLFVANCSAAFVSKHSLHSYKYRPGCLFVLITCFRKFSLKKKSKQKLILEIYRKSKQSIKSHTGLLAL